MKLRVTLCVALIVGTLTLIIGLLRDARLVTILYRTGISVIIFGICGYMISNLVENYLIRFLSQSKPKGQKVDIVSEQEEVGVVHSEPIFSPFTSDSLERVSRLQE